MGKKGLSFEEKRQRLKQLFLETKGVYTLKELEKVASKEKGIVSKTVEEVLKSLVDDGEVMTDKVGTSNYFWAFPSQELVVRRNKLEQMTKELEALQAKAAELRESIDAMMADRVDSPERTAGLEELKELQQKKAQLSEELAVYAENDPAIVEALKKEADEALTAANRWTDNIFSLRKYCETKFSISGSDFDRNFQIPEDFDYLS
eukprot:m51a1_g4167 hypothetical protein (205) ;mRNA; f:297195-298236